MLCYQINVLFYYGKALSITIELKIVFYKLEINFVITFKSIILAFKLHYFVSQLNIVRYEIIFISVLYWIFLKKYKKCGPKYKETLPSTTTEGLGNIIGL